MRIQLSGLELQFIDDNLTLYLGEDSLIAIRQPTTASGIPAQQQLIHKIGDGLLRVYKEGIEPTVVDFSEAELWTLREMANSNFRTQSSTDAGLVLKLKIHEALRTVDIVGTVDSFIADLGLFNQEEERVSEPNENEDTSATESAT
jgi:hypothetical protein